jgi:BASS family bile acid:Na+ symporter
MDLAALVPLAVKACIIAIVFSLGLRARWSDVAYLIHRPALLLRSLAAMYFLVPIIAILLALMFTLHLSPEVKEIIVLMAISAGAPVLPHKAIQWGANPAHVYSFAALAAVIAIASVPLSLAILSMVFDPPLRIAPLEVAKIVTMMFLAPLFLGMVVRHFLPALAERASRLLTSIALVVLVLLVVVIVAKTFRDLVGLGWMPYVVFVLLTFAALAVGHWLGGPEPGDRTALALACATRFPALAVLIIAVNLPEARPLAAIAAFLLASNLAAIPYMVWRKKKGATAGAGPTRAPATSA